MRTPLLVCTFASLAALGAPAQSGQPPFLAPAAVLPSDSPPFQRLLDFDGDGDLDAIGSRVRSDRTLVDIAIWRNDAGTFTQVYRANHTVITASVANMPCAIGDLDGNGLQDAVFASGNTVLEVRSQPGGTFTFHATPLPPGDPVAGVVVWDWDGDGRADQALLRTGFFPTLLVRFTAGGEASLALPAFTLAGPHLIQADADAAMEIGITQNGHRMLPYDVVGGALSPLPVVATTTSTYGVFLWAPGDVDRDGDTDLVVFKPGWNQPHTYQVFRHDGQRLAAEPEAVGGPAEYLADVDGDGDLDGVCCGSGGGGPTLTWPSLGFASTFEVALNDGSGVFAPAFAFPGAGSSSMAGCTDLDGDGDQDLVAGRCVFHGRGPWLAQPMPPTGANFATLRSRFLHDHDRDGDVDVFPSAYGGSMGNGDGTFARVQWPGVAPPAGRTFAGGASVDFDGDGAKDMVVPQMLLGTPWTFEVMVVLRNNGGGSYTYGGPVTAPGVRIGFGYTVDHFLAADLDGDGDEDLVANSNPGQDNYRCEVFWRQGAGYVPGPVFPNHRIDGVADFDGDGHPDLLQSDASNWWIARGTGNSATPFLPPQMLAMHQGRFAPRALTIADFDDDGRPDLFLPITPHSVQLNRTAAPGPISFVMGFQLTGIVLAQDGRVAAGDFDGDGRCDLVVGPLVDEPGVSMLLRRKGASGAPILADYDQHRLVLGDGFAADADGDGDLDLIGTLVVRNLRHSGDAAGRRLQYGAGVAGEAGAVPVLGVRGVLRPGHLAQIALTGVPGPTLAALDLAFGAAQLPGVPVPGLTLYLDPLSLLSATVFVAGSGQGRAAAEFVLPMPVSPAWAGVRFWLQAFVLDPAAPTIITQSNGLAVTVGN